MAKIIQIREQAIKSFKMSGFKNDLEIRVSTSYLHMYINSEENESMC